MTEYRSGEDIKKAIRAIMKADGYTTITLGEAIGMPNGNVSRTLNKLNPTFGQVRDMAAAMGYKLVFDIVKADSEEN